MVDRVIDEALSDAPAETIKVTGIVLKVLRHISFREVTTHVIHWRETCKIAYSTSNPGSDE